MSTNDTGGNIVVSEAAPSIASRAPSRPIVGAGASGTRAGATPTPAPAAPAGGAPVGAQPGAQAALSPTLSKGADSAATGPAPAEPGAPSPAPADGARYVLSAPVLILPSAKADDAPALVQPKSGELALLQRSGDAKDAGDNGPSGVVLDQISYGQAGDVSLRGRARPRHAVRVYGNGQMLVTAPVQNGAWAVSLPRDQVERLSLFRVDEIGPAGQVTSRVEAPFRYTGDKPLVLRDREVVVRKGDNLWEIAEQYYGEGIRYSLIYGANSELIRDPDLIYPDQVFSVPELVEAR